MSNTLTALRGLVALLKEEDPIEVGCHCTSADGMEVRCVWCKAEDAIKEEETSMNRRCLPPSGSVIEGMPEDFCAEVPEHLRGPQPDDCDCVYYGPPFRRDGIGYLGGPRGYGHQRIKHNCPDCRATGKKQQ